MNEERARGMLAGAILVLLNAGWSAAAIKKEVQMVIAVSEATKG